MISFLIVIYGVFVGGIYWAARTLSRGPWPGRIVLMVAASWPIADFSASKLTACYYQNTQGGSWIYETAENVDGIYLGDSGNGCGSSCEGYLIEFADQPFYDFVESRATSVTDYNLVPTPGLYRFSREQSGHPNCKGYYAWLAGSDRLKNDARYRDHCIATWPIDEVSAKYTKESKFTESPIKMGTLRESSTVISETASGKILAEYRSYSIKSVLPWSQHERPFSCGRGPEFLNTSEILKSSRSGS